MATTGYNILTGPADLSTVFDSYVSGTQVAPTGYKLANGDDLSTRFAPYVSGTQAAPTGYKLENGDDLRSVFAPTPPPFPTVQSSVPGIGTYNCVSMNGSNCVFATRGEVPTGSPHSYLYWSNDFGATVTRSTIGGSVQKFFGCVAISGQNAIAMGSVGTASTPANFYLSTNAGVSYTVTSFSGQVAALAADEPYISIDGLNAIWGSYSTAPHYSSNAGASWTESTGGAIRVTSVIISGDNAYFGTYVIGGFYYSRNRGQNFTKNTTVTNVNRIILCGSNLYIVGNNNIYRSTDHGVTISIITKPSFTGFPSSITGFPGTNGHFLWFATDSGNVNYYTNNADSTGTVTWTTVSNGVSNASTCAANGTRMIAGSGYGTFGSGIYWGRNAYIT